jgi:hypothetical protein
MRIKHQFRYRVERRADRVRFALIRIKTDGAFGRRELLAVTPISLAADNSHDVDTYQRRRESGGMVVAWHSGPMSVAYSWRTRFTLGPAPIEHQSL